MTTECPECGGIVWLLWSQSWIDGDAWSCLCDNNFVPDFEFTYQGRIYVCASCHLVVG
jgi:hypothetical protein